MLVVLLLQCVIVFSIIRASRSRLENALPVFAFFVVLMPLESRLVIPGICDFNTMRVSLLTLLTLFILRRKERVNHGPLPLKSLMMLNVAWAICSTVYSLSVVTSVKQLISQVLEYYLLYYLFLRIITRVQTLYHIVFAVSMAVGLCCVFSLFEVYAHYSILRIFPENLWITYDNSHDPLYVEWGRGLRVRSTFPHPILFGDALAMTIPPTLFLIGVWENKQQRRVLWLALALMCWALYKTSSRGPWLATGIGLMLLFALIRGPVRRYLLVIGCVGALVIASWPGIWQTIANIYLSSTDANSPVGASYLYRDVLSQTIKAAVASDSTRTLLGYGLGTFRELGLDITFLNMTQRSYTCDDNWALFIYELGYVGLFFTSLLLATPLYVAFRNYRRLPRPDNAISGVLLISLVSFYFLLLSVAGYSWGQQGYLAWILISLVMSQSRLPQEIESPEETLEETTRGFDEYDLNIA